MMVPPINKIGQQPLYTISNYEADFVWHSDTCPFLQKYSYLKKVVYTFAVIFCCVVVFAFAFDTQHQFVKDCDHRTKL